MAPRLELQSKLEGVLGSTNVYFQPPSSLQMQYPCIVYKRDDARTAYANNSPYRYTKRYMVTHISRNPDSEIPAAIAMLPLSKFNRYFASDNLHHDVFDLYF